MATKSKGNSKEKKDTRVPRGKGSLATKSKGNSKCQEGKEMAEARVPGWKQQGTRGKKKRQRKRKFNIKKLRTKLRTKGKLQSNEKWVKPKVRFIEDEQQWLITGSLHIPAEFTSEEDREKFESQPKSGVKEPDGVKPSILYNIRNGSWC